jgi:RNA polymerase sigma-70 factor (sigma-E family)
VSAHDHEYTQYVAARLDRLRRLGFLLSGSWDRADDAVQTALVKLYVAWPRIERSRSIDGYVRQMVVRCLIDERRRGFGRYEQTVSESPDSVAADHSGATDRRIIATGALRRLPPRQRAAIVLRYWEDLSVEQTAQLLDCSTGTVKSQCARGLRSLREELNEAVEPRAEGAYRRD